MICPVCKEIVAVHTRNPFPSTPVPSQQDCARELPSPSPSPPTFRLWVSTARGFLCFEALAARDSSSPQVRVARKRNYTLVKSHKSQLNQRYINAKLIDRPVKLYPLQKTLTAAPETIPTLIQSTLESNVSRLAKAHDDPGNPPPSLSPIPFPSPPSQGG